MSRGSVSACKTRNYQNIFYCLHDTSCNKQGMGFTSAVHAAIAEAAIDLCRGRALPFAGGDISASSPLSLSFPSTQCGPTVVRSISMAVSTAGLGSFPRSLSSYPSRIAAGAGAFETLSMPVLLSETQEQGS